MARPLLTRRGRLEIRPERRLPVRTPGWRFRQRIGTGGNPPKMKTAVWPTYTYNTGDLDDFSRNGSVNFQKGDNWRVYYDAVKARIEARGGTVDLTDFPTIAVIEDPATYPGEIYQSHPGTDTGQIIFMREAVMDLCSLCDLAVLGSHAPPKEHLKSIRARCKIPAFRLGLAFLNFESYNQSILWQVDLRGMQNLSVDCYLVADSTNSHGCDCIDYFEGDATPVYCPPTLGTTPGDTVHSAHVKVDTAVAPGRQDSYIEEMTVEYETFLDNRYGATTPDGLPEFVIWDNMLENLLLLGNMTNDYPSGYTNAIYRQSWRDFMTALRSNVGGQQHWTNSGLTFANYSATDAPHRFVEFFQRKGDGSLRTMAELETDLNLVASGPLGTALIGGYWSGFGWNEQFQWWTADGPGVLPARGGLDYGTWEQVYEHCRSAAILEQVYINNGRALGSGGYLFWQPQFTDPREYV